MMGDGSQESLSSFTTTVEPVQTLRSAPQSSLASAARLSNERTTSSSVHSSHSQAANSNVNFIWDNAKRWWNFGSGNVDKNAGPAWVPDDAVNQCTGCARTFDFFNRKHHCRLCGQIFCNNCSSNYKLLPVEFAVREPQRTCRSCAAEIEPLQEELAKTITNQTRSLSFDPNAPSKFMSAPVSFSMTAEITKAAHSIENIFGYVPNAMIKVDRSIPETLLRQAKGIAFLTVLKGGFLVSGKIGTGLVIAKLDRPINGIDWSPPSAIGTMGLGWGAQVGGELTELVIVLTTKESLEAFSGTSQVAIGAEMGVSVGPFGRTGEASLNFGDRTLAPVYAYSQSSGFFAGVSLEGAVIVARNDVNRRFYGRDYATHDLLAGTALAPPKAAFPLYQAVQKVFSTTSDLGGEVI